MLDALRIINPSKDYTHVYEFIAEGSLYHLPAKEQLASQQNQQSKAEVIRNQQTDTEESPEALKHELPLVTAVSVPLKPLQAPPAVPAALRNMPQALPQAPFQSNAIAQPQAPGQELNQVR